MEKQKRYKSWAVWLSVFGLIGIILNQAGVFTRLGIDTVTWDAIVNAIGSILIGFGILNNPTKKGGF